MGRLRALVARLAAKGSGLYLAAATFIVAGFLWLGVGTLGFRLLVHNDEAGERGMISVPQSQLAARGQLGDMFGVAGSLFAAMSLAGVSVALVLQNHQLRQQQKEIESQRIDTLQSRLEAANASLHGMAEAYWSDSFQEARNRAQLLIGIVGPLLTEKFPPTSPRHDPQRARLVLDAVIEHLGAGSIFTLRKAAVELESYVEHIGHPVYRQLIIRKPIGGSGFSVTENFALVDELTLWVGSLVRVLDMFRRYSHLAGTVRHVHGRLQAAWEKTDHGGDVDLQQAADFLFPELRWWGPPLTALVELTKHRLGARGVPFQWYDTVLRYFEDGGFASFDNMPTPPALAPQIIPTP